MMLLFCLFYIYSLVYICACIGESSHSFWMLSWGSYLWDICVLILVVFSIISGAELQCTVIFQVVIRFQIVASFKHAELLLSCSVCLIWDFHQAMLYPALGLSSLGSQKTSHFFHLLGGLCWHLCFMEHKVKVPNWIQKNLHLHNIKKTNVRCQEVLRTCVFFISCFPVSSMFFEK